MLSYIYDRIEDKVKAKFVKYEVRYVTKINNQETVIINEYKGLNNAALAYEDINKKYHFRNDIDWDIQMAFSEGFGGIPKFNIRQKNIHIPMKINKHRVL